jgi:processive 1,2-diacylglycerol beta-glucosyltransferase
MRRVLILSASGGAGHLRAAEAVETALGSASRELDVRNIDVLTLAGPAFRDAYSKWYLAVVSRAPALWRYLYDRLDRPAKGRPLNLRHLLDNWNTRRLRGTVADFAPHAIVCTHFLPAEVLARERRKQRLVAPVGVVVTDADVHRLWIHRGVDRYFVARDEAAALLAAIGVDASVEVTGIPIDPRFAEPADRASLRRRHGLPDGPVVLLLTGGFGVGPVQELAARLEQARRPAHFVVVAGRNEKLRQALASAAGPRTSVLGFTREIHEWMAAADLLVTKPGGLTTSEALARRLPMLLVNPIPGQEEHNADALLELGVAAKASSLEVLAWKVDALLAEPARLEAMRSACGRVARPHAAAAIARWALEAE